MYLCSVFFVMRSFSVYRIIIRPTIATSSIRSSTENTSFIIVTTFYYDRMASSPLFYFRLLLHLAFLYFLPPLRSIPVLSSTRKNENATTNMLNRRDGTVTQTKTLVSACFQPKAAHHSAPWQEPVAAPWNTRDQRQFTEGGHLDCYGWVHIVVVVNRVIGHIRPLAVMTASTAGEDNNNKNGSCSNRATDKKNSCFYRIHK